MADKNDGGDKTEKPTPKKLQDARKKGDVIKSKEVTSTLLLVVWLGLGALAVGFAAARIGMLFDALFVTLGRGWQVTGFAGAARDLGAQAVELALTLVAMLLIPVAAVGLLTDFLQAGPVLTFEKMKPKLDSLNPVEGIKRMFSMDNLVEVIKALAKTALLFMIGWLIVKSALPQMVGLARSPQIPVQAVGALMWDLTVQSIAWTIALFALVSLLDAVWQRYTYMKKMRMSIRDIKQEMKESEGDPYVKMQRKRTQREWSQQSAQQAARTANVLVVNPTHVAIAIEYDGENTPVPIVSAKGEDLVALAMREAAQEAGVPVVRNIPLARDMLARAEEGDVVPQDLFEIIAEVILWAREVRAELDAQRREERGEGDGDGAAPAAPRERRIATPGEDLTRYPLKPWNNS
jgi:flagellar biosynthetic protein FlhB/type III secretion protein U